jgi:hypothetical protein
VSAGIRATHKLTSDVLFCFPGLRFDVFSPYRDGRYCSVPKPGKKKQKSYNYRSAILMVHRFRSSFVCSPRYCVRSGARLRGNWRPSLKHCRLRQDMAGQGSLGAQKHGCGSGLRFSNGSTAISFCYPGSSFQRVPANRYRQSKQRCHHCKNSWLLLMHLRDALVMSGQSLSTGLMSCRRERSLSLPRKFFQKLRPNYSDEMAQFVFDIAGHGDGVCDFLAQ